MYLQIGILFKESQTNLSFANASQAIQEEGLPLAFIDLDAKIVFQPLQVFIPTHKESAGMLQMW